MTWKPLAPATPVRRTDREIAEMAVAADLPFDTLRKISDDLLDSGEFFQNDTYQVVRRREGDLVHLSIRRLDRGPARDWRDFQRIKNELIGPECEALELYPAESRKVDTANEFHLWGIADPAVRIPAGFEKGLVSEVSAGGAVQRKFDEPD